MDDIVARCPGTAETVLKNCREVLLAVLSQDPARWPTDDLWPSLLPDWFIEASAPEESPEDAERYIQWLLALPYEERVRHASEEARRFGWSISSFLYWFGPKGERVWRWWDARVEDPEILRVTVEIDGWPWGGGDALLWLLRASGASTAEREI